MCVGVGAGVYVCVGASPYVAQKSSVCRKGTTQNGRARGVFTDWPCSCGLVDVMMDIDLLR